MDAIVLAAGSSSRMGTGNEKAFMRLAGKPMMVTAVQLLIERPEIHRVVVVVRRESQATAAALLTAYLLDERVAVVAGGRSRQESVWCGLQMVESERVVVHEAARPLVSTELLDRILAPMNPAVVPVIPIPFTVAVGDSVMEESTERSRLRNIQLPQVYDTDVLRRAHTAAREQRLESTEDSQLVFAQGVEVLFVEGAIENIKITYPFDLRVAQSWLYYAERAA